MAVGHLVLCFLLGCLWEGVIYHIQLCYFLSQPQLSHWAYLPVISPTFFGKKFMRFSSLGKHYGLLLFISHTGARSGVQDLHGSSVQDVILQFPPCWQPHSPLLVFELVDLTWSDISSEVLGWHFPSRLFSFKLLSFFLNQFPPTLWFASGLLSYLPELSVLYFEIQNTTQHNNKTAVLPFQWTWKERERKRDMSVWFVFLS